jgi:hypothetical protein
MAGLREVKRGDESIVTAADDDDGAHVRSQESGVRS